jgi:hypothetical protein
MKAKPGSCERLDKAFVLATMFGKPVRIFVSREGWDLICSDPARAGSIKIEPNFKSYSDVLVTIREEPSGAWFKIVSDGDEIPGLFDPVVEMTAF